MRMTKHDLPGLPTRCPLECVYREQGLCSEPRINKGNSDAACHTMGNKELLSFIEPQR